MVALAGVFVLAFTAFRGGETSPAAMPGPVFHQGPIVGYGPTSTAAPPQRPVLALEQVRVVLAQAYYRHVSPEWLAEPSISKILDRLDDPYTEYLSPAEFDAFRNGLDQRYYGVGLRLDQDTQGLVVIRSLAGPARDAGIRPGDVIVTIDGRSATTLPFDESLALFKGEQGTTVKLTVQRPGETRALDFEVVRGPITVPAVRSRLIKTSGKLIAYIRLRAFSGDAAARVGAAARHLIDRGAQGVILDLRGDPGGYLTQAVAVSSLFLESGIVCQTSGANQQTRSYAVSGVPIDTDSPLAVLVDGTTASASEIVAGALRDNRRAVLVGERTYGKATVQSLVELANGGALKLTTATYLTPSGSSIGGRGIKPGVKAVDNPLTRPDEAVLTAAKALLKRLDHT